MTSRYVHIALLRRLSTTLIFRVGAINYVANTFKMPSQDSMNPNAEPVEDEDMMSQWHETWLRIQRILDRLDDRFQVTPKLIQLRAYTQEHPYQTVGALAIAVFCSIPVFGFLIFVFWSALLTVCGFLLVEGALLTIALGVLCMSLVIFGSISLFLVGLIGLAYLVIINGRAIFSSAYTRLESQVEHHLPELYNKFNRTPQSERNHTPQATENNTTHGKMATEQTQARTTKADVKNLKKSTQSPPSVDGSVQVLNADQQNGMGPEVIGDKPDKLSLQAGDHMNDSVVDEHTKIKSHPDATTLAADKLKEQYIIDDLSDLSENIAVNGGRDGTLGDTD